MTRAQPRPRQADPQGGYLVRQPRESDAIGGSLRHAFGDDARTPRDFDLLLARIDGTRH